MNSSRPTQNSRQIKKQPGTITSTQKFNRRQILQAAGITVGVNRLIPTTANAQTQGPPKLTHAYLKVTESGDLECLLITQSELSEDDSQQVIESLSAEDPNTGEEIQAEAQDLDLGFFYDKYTLENRDISPEEFANRINNAAEGDRQPAGDQTLERLRELNRNGATPLIPRPPGRSVEAVIPGVADVPSQENRFTGQPTVCPRITYDGGFPTSSPLSKVATIQFHDGFFYQSPVSDSDFRYPFDARYDISGTNSDTPEVHGLLDGGTVEFNVPFAGIASSFDPEVIAPQFQHRAHPALAGLRSLAIKQAILFTSLGQRVNQEIVTPTEALQEVGGTSINAATSVTGIFATTPPTSADAGSVAKSLLFSAGPMIISGAGAAVGSTVVAPLAATALSALGTATAFVSAAEALRNFGETLEDVTGRIQNGRIQALARDTQCPTNPERQNDLSCELDLSSPPNLSTPIAVGQLGLFDQFYAPKSLIRADSLGELEAAADSYRALTTEYAQQASLINGLIFDPNIGGSVRLEPDLFNLFESVLFHLTGEESIPERQAELISSVQRTFGSPTAAFSIPEGIAAGNSITFDGTQSAGPYGSEIEFQWQVTDTADDTVIATGQDNQLGVTFEEPGTYEVVLEVFSPATERSNRQSEIITVNPAPESQYTLTVTETRGAPGASEVGSTTVTDSTAPAGGHIGFSTVGDSQTTADRGVVDTLRLSNGDTIEDWDRSDPLSAYNRTNEGGGRFERFFGQTTSGDTSLRVFSGCCGDTIVSTEERVNLDGGEQIKVDLLQGTDRSDTFAHKTSVLIGTDAEGKEGIKLELINDGRNRTAGARIITPSGEESRIEFTPTVDTFYTFTLDLADSFESVPSNLERFDTNNEPGIQADEVIDAIIAFNSGDQLGGERVTSRDVIDLIIEYNSTN